MRCTMCRMCAGKESHSGTVENMLSASSLAETHISPDDIPYTDHHDNDDGINYVNVHNMLMLQIYLRAKSCQCRV